MRPKILLVDDNPVAQKMTAKAFKNAGYEVFLAWDEEECLRIARSEKPDCVLMDVIFPDGDGREFVKKLKEDRKKRLQIGKYDPSYRPVMIPAYEQAQLAPFFDPMAEIRESIEDVVCRREFHRNLHRNTIVSWFKEIL